MIDNPSKATGPSGAKRLPAEFVEASRLFEVLGYSSREAKVIGQDASERVLHLEIAVDHAHLVGRIRRYTIRNQNGGDAISAYKRADVLALMKNGG